MKSEALKAHREKLKAAGICMSCHKRPAREGMVTCAFCSKRVYQSKKIRMKGGKVCSYCAQREVSEGHGMCAKCLVDVRPSRRNYDRSVAQHRRDTGCCGSCGIVLDEFSKLAGYRSCPTCLSNKQRKKEVRHASIRT